MREGRERSENSLPLTPSSPFCHSSVTDNEGEAWFMRGVHGSSWGKRGKEAKWDGGRNRGQEEEEVWRKGHGRDEEERCVVFVVVVIACVLLVLVCGACVIIAPRLT